MVVHPGMELSKSAAMVEDFRRWLTVERRLADGTVGYYVWAARSFLSAFEGRDPKSLTASDVIGYAAHQWPRLAVPSAKGSASALRSLLRYWHLEGVIDRQLALAVPAPSGPYERGLPRYLGSSELSAVLDDQGGETVVARRDHAMVVMMARMGLRAGEVTGLKLDDLDWRAGEIVVRGKRGRTERLPLPVDVGKALVAYLQARPPGRCRAVFLRARGPLVGVSRAVATQAVHRVCARAGVSPAGAHRLRPSAATSMLRAGASLEEVGQVLRQRSTYITSLYAKVDFVALRGLARPWPRSAA
jgi:integrase/recombinase XerD